MLNYVVVITFGCYSHRKFIFSDQMDALKFARMARLYADKDEDITVTIEVNLVRFEDLAEDQAE